MKNILLIIFLSFFLISCSDVTPSQKSICAQDSAFAKTEKAAELMYKACIEKAKKSKGIYSAFHLYIVKLNAQAPINRQELYKGLKSSNIGVNVHYIPVHLQPYYRKKGFKIGFFKNAETHAKLSVSIPVFVGLKKNVQNDVISILLEYYNNY